jgi:hypothetical protein
LALAELTGLTEWFLPFLPQLLASFASGAIVGRLERWSLVGRQARRSFSMLWKAVFVILLFANPWAVAAVDDSAEPAPVVSDEETQSDTVRYLIDTGPLRIRDQPVVGA